jgi:hypothetical protein
VQQGTNIVSTYAGTPGASDFSDDGLPAELAHGSSSANDQASGPIDSLVLVPLERYQDGLKIMKASNWLVSATINGVPVDTPSVREFDAWQAEWENNATAWPSLVTAGTDFFAVSPIPAQLAGVTMTVIGNAPIPILDTDFVQVSRDVMDVILDYAQVLAAFKQGGAEFSSTMDLEKNFFKMAAETNKRLWKTGIFPDLVHDEGKREDRHQPR